MLISVAMTTYNGEKYIEEQMKSIFSQSVLPDELVICDDHSKDNTCNIIENLIKVAPNSIHIIFHKNNYNIGFSKNFEQCISLCSGDIIFTADQDDVWIESKIEAMELLFKNNPSAIMAFSDAIVINQDGLNIGVSLNNGWDTRTDKSDSNELAILTIRRKGCTYGNTMAFKKELFINVRPFPNNYGHDEWLTLCAPLFGNVICSNKKLVKYRRHNTNTSGIHPTIKYRLFHWDKEAWFTHALSIKTVYETYLNRFSQLIPKEIKEELLLQISFQQLLSGITLEKTWGYKASQNVYTRYL